ncbi:MAG: M42 family peptidase [Oscillospiraceae bacterium]|nr:M42 family peptidase [Oscillospiraceae bacterium]
MLAYLKELCALCGTSGAESAVRDYLMEKIQDFPDILECRTDSLGNLLVHKKGRKKAKHTVMIGAHMDEVGLIVRDILPDGRFILDTVGGIEPDAVIGRTMQIPGIGYGVVGAEPVHNLKPEDREKKPSKQDLILDIGAKNRETVADLGILPGDAVYFFSKWTELGGGKRVASKAIDDRFGCACMLKMLRDPIEFDTWFCFFVQEEIGLRGSRTATYAVNPDFALILETTTAGDLDGVTGADRVCALGAGAVVSFMDRSTIYDKELYKIAFAEAENLNIPCQTKTRIAGGNDAGAVHISRDGVRTLAISIPCRYLHSPYCTAQISDMEQSCLLAERMLLRMHTL